MRPLRPPEKAILKTRTATEDLRFARRSRSPWQMTRRGSFREPQEVLSCSTISKLDAALNWRVLPCRHTLHTCTNQYSSNSTQRAIFWQRTFIHKDFFTRQPLWRDRSQSSPASQHNTSKPDQLLKMTQLAGSPLPQSKEKK